MEQQWWRSKQQWTEKLLPDEPLPLEISDTDIHVTEERGNVQDISVLLGNAVRALAQRQLAIGSRGLRRSSELKFN